MLLDDEDYLVVQPFRWQPTKIYNTFYAMTKIDGKTKYMHQMIMGFPKSIVDHIDRNGLNNQRSNLRITTQSINIANAGMFANNTSGYKGVVKYRSGWKAQIKYHQRVIQSNQINNLTYAVLLRDELARRLFGELTFINLPNISPSARIKSEAQRLIDNQAG